MLRPIAQRVRAVPSGAAPPHTATAATPRSRCAVASLPPARLRLSRLGWARCTRLGAQKTDAVNGEHVGGQPAEAEAEPAVGSHPLVDLPPDDNHTRMRVARQSYIPTPRSKLIEKLREETPEERWEYMSQVLRCLESIYQVEYQLAGEEVQQVLQHLNHSVIVPDGIQLVDTAEMEAISSQDGWDERDFQNWELEGVPPSALYNTAEDVDRLNTVYVRPAEMRSLEDRFLEMTLVLLGKAHFRPMGARDSALADTLNASYLSQFFVRPDSSGVDSEFAASLTDDNLRDKFGAVAVFTRGWGKERRSGRLMFAKIDHMQQAVAKLLLSNIQGVFTLLRKQAKEQVVSARTQLPDSLAPPDPSRPTGCRVDPADGAGDAPQPAKPKHRKPQPPNLGAALRKVGSDIKEGLAYYGLIPPLDRIELEEFDNVWPVSPVASRRQPVFIERRTVGDAMGKGIPLKDLRGGRLKTLFGKIELEEPTFHEMLVLCRPRRTTARITKWQQEVQRWLAKLISGEEPPDRPYSKERVLLRAYKDIPVPLWRIVFPFKALAFRPIDLIRVDLIAVFGLVAIILQVKSGNPWLQLVWIVSLLAQALRVVLRYRRMFTSFENFVSKTMLNKTIAGQEGVVEFLSRSAALQQYKQVVVLYHMAVLEGPARLEGPQEAVAQDIEHMLASTGCEVTFDVKEATAELQRLGLLSQGSGANGSGAGMQVVPPEKAVAKLKEHWGSILTSQLQQPPASNDIDHAIRALEHHKNQTSR
mmetsp:Transcript_3664/g.9386  ORF Transcript_3664/g.9386 Transcript_3664/m.9386 type:complete len:758 (-) Transcript_3664:30-2303(-)